MLRYMVIRILVAVLLNSLDTCCVVCGRDLYMVMFMPGYDRCNIRDMSRLI
jgi:hypothetical protein